MSLLSSGSSSACHLLSRRFLARFILLPWNWRQVPPKRRLTFNGLHGVLSHKIENSFSSIIVHPINMSHLKIVPWRIIYVRQSRFIPCFTWNANVRWKCSGQLLCGLQPESLKPMYTFTEHAISCISLCGTFYRVRLIGIRCLATFGLCMFLVRIHGTEAQYVLPGDPVTTEETDREHGERCPRNARNNRQKHRSPLLSPVQERDGENWAPKLGSLCATGRGYTCK
jgi:hypothetical protein